MSPASAPPVKAIRCPKCGSFHVFLAMRPGVPPQGENVPFMNATSKRCSNCAHEWDRQAYRGVGVQCDEPKPGFWARLWSRLWHFLAPHLF